MRRPELRTYDPASGRADAWEMPAWIGCFALLRDGRLLVALRTGLALFDPADGSLRPLVAAPYDARRFCFNDGGCDRSGHFFVGPMYHPLAPADARAGAPQEAPMWRYDPARREMVPLKLPAVRISNGLAFSPDGRTLYHADTPTKTIWACDHDPESGTVENQRIFARVAEGGDHGGPDGAAVDRDGFYVCAVFGGGCLLRFDPDGRVERRLPLPIRYPTMPAFGDQDLATLYVTSASFPDGDGGGDAHAGGLFALAAPVPGLPTCHVTIDEESFP
jgi:sugar lactone lactonase YvrE